MEGNFDKKLVETQPPSQNMRQGKRVARDRNMEQGLSTRIAKTLMSTTCEERGSTCSDRRAEP